MRYRITEWHDGNGKPKWTADFYTWWCGWSEVARAGRVYFDDRESALEACDFHLAETKRMSLKKISVEVWRTQ